MNEILFKIGDIISPVKDIEFVQNGVKHQRFQGRQYAVIPKFAEWYNLHSDLFFKIG